MAKKSPKSEFVSVDLQALRKARDAGNNLNAVLWGCTPTPDLWRISERLEELRSQLDKLVCDGVNEAMVRRRKKSA